MKKELNNVTLLGIDCIDPYRLKNVMDICQREIEFHSTILLTSEDMRDSRVVRIPRISSFEEYSLFCLRDLSNYVETEFVLLIQWDGFILNPNSWHKSFLEDDYIGSPWLVKDWAISDFYFPENLRGEYVVGNGGFSLRSKKLLRLTERLYKEGILENSHPEDIAISVWYREMLKGAGIKFAPIEIAKQFSFEGGDEKYHKQFGFHGYYTDIESWFN